MPLQSTQTCKECNMESYCKSPGRPKSSFLDYLGFDMRHEQI